MLDELDEARLRVAEADDLVVNIEVPGGSLPSLIAYHNAHVMTVFQTDDAQAHVPMALIRIDYVYVESMQVLGAWENLYAHVEWGDGAHYKRCLAYKEERDLLPTITLDEWHRAMAVRPQTTRP